MVSMDQLDLLDPEDLKVQLDRWVNAEKKVQLAPLDQQVHRDLVDLLEKLAQRAKQAQKEDKAQQGVKVALETKAPWDQLGLKDQMDHRETVESQALMDLLDQWENRENVETQAQQDHKVNVASKEKLDHWEERVQMDQLDQRVQQDLVDPQESKENRDQEEILDLMAHREIVEILDHREK